MSMPGPTAASMLAVTSRALRSTCARKRLHSNSSAGDFAVNPCSIRFSAPFFALFRERRRANAIERHVMIGQDQAVGGRKRPGPRPVAAEDANGRALEPLEVCRP